MKKKIILTVATGAIITIASSFSFYLYTQKHKKITVNTCPFEVKTCADGSKVTRVGSSCEFALCPQLVISTPTVNNEEPLLTSTTSSETSATSSNPSNIPPLIVAKKTTQLTTKAKPQQPSSPTGILSVVKSFFTKTAETKTPDFTPKNIVPEVTPLTYVESVTNNTPYSIPPTDTNFAGEKFIVKDGNIIASDNTIVTFISGGALSDITTTNAGWESHIVNAVPVNNVAPIIGAIPVEGLPGKYYISENSFGNREACEFSNKIFIYDSNTNVATLMYEENSTTLDHEDPRACNSEIFLLATENSSLILKYHTIGTNTLCDSAWSEPEKTFYLDVTNLSSGMKKYAISETLYNNAEQEETACRAKLSP